MYYKQYVCEIILDNEKSKETIFKTIIRALTIDEAEDFAIKEFNEKTSDNLFDPDTMSVKVSLVENWVDKNSSI